MDNKKIGWSEFLGGVVADELGENRSIPIIKAVVVGGDNFTGQLRGTGNMYLVNGEEVTQAELQTHNRKNGLDTSVYMFS